MDLADFILLSGAAYTCMGVVLAVAFLSRGVVLVDPAARGSGLGFRLIIMPGCVLLWPVVAVWWAKALRSPAPARPEVTA